MNGRGRRSIKDRDEDLFLFKELQKREKERSVCLLQPVSDDFEPNSGNLSFYRMSSGKKGSGFEFLRETDKNDYDWLKTPPATPLFQSLDMETNAPDLILQRELPLQVMHQELKSRFSGNSETAKVINVEKPKPITNQTATQPEYSQLRPKTAQVKNIVGSIPNPNQTVTHSRPATAEAKNTAMNQNHGHNKRPTTAEAKSARRSQQSANPNTTQLATKRVHATKPISQRNNITVTEPRNRGVSPQVRRSIVVPLPPQDQSPPSDQRHQILVLSDETPPNLRTDRSLSATRGRPVIKPTKSSWVPDRSTSATRIRPGAKKEEAVGSNKAMRRQSCSPSVARGRKVEDQVMGIGIQTRSNGQVLGSKMVDRLMNARKSSEKKETRTVNAGFGRFMLSNIRT